MSRVKSTVPGAALIPKLLAPSQSRAARRMGKRRRSIERILVATGRRRNLRKRVTACSPLYQPDSLASDSLEQFRLPLTLRAKQPGGLLLGMDAGSGVARIAGDGGFGDRAFVWLRHQKEDV